MGNGEEEGLLSSIGNFFKKVWCFIKCGWWEIIKVVVTLVVVFSTLIFITVVFFAGIGGDAFITVLLPPGAPVFGALGILWTVLFIIVFVLVILLTLFLIEKSLMKIWRCWSNC